MKHEEREQLQNKPVKPTIPVETKLTETIAASVNESVNESVGHGKPDEKTSKAIVVNKDGKEKSKRKPTLNQRIAKAKNTLSRAEKQLRIIELQSKPEYIALKALLDNHQTALKDARLAYKELETDDKLIIAKHKATIARLQYMVLEDKKHIANAENPAKPIPAKKSDEDKLSMTNVDKLSVRKGDNEVQYGLEKKAKAGIKG